MRSWLIQSILCDFNPTPFNYIKFKWLHFHFCKSDDPTITASLWVVNLTNEVGVGLGEHKLIKKKLLVLVVMKKLLENARTKRELLALLEKKEHPHLNQEIKQFLERVSLILQAPHEEVDYESLIRDTAAMKEFIAFKFRAGKISERITDMKNFSYKKILSGKSNTGSKGQLKPQLKQIAANSSIFGEDVSTFAAKILKDHFEDTV